MQPNFIPLDAISTQPFDLDSIQIAAPCRADWNSMSGDNRARHCKACAKNVYNLSALTRAEAVRLIQGTEGHLCVQLHRRADGTLITGDCTVGISTRKSGGLTKVFAAVVVAIAGVFGVSSASATNRNSAPTLGAPMLLGEMAPMRGQIEAPVIAAKKSVKSHAKPSAKPARKPKFSTKPSLQHRRHRR